MGDTINTLENIMDDITVVQDEFKILTPEKQQEFISHIQMFTYNIVDFAEDSTKENQNGN
jgi:hypothetical protein